MAMKDATLIALAMIAAAGMLGVIAIGAVNIPSAEAAGCFDAFLKSGKAGPLLGVNASKGRCVQ